MEYFLFLVVHGDFVVSQRLMALHRAAISKLKFRAKRHPILSPTLYSSPEFIMSGWGRSTIDVKLLLFTFYSFCRMIVLERQLALLQPN